MDANISTPATKPIYLQINNPHCFACNKRKCKECSTQPKTRLANPMDHNFPPLKEHHHSSLK